MRYHVILAIVALALFMGQTATQPADDLSEQPTRADVKKLQVRVKTLEDRIADLEARLKRIVDAQTAAAKEQAAKPVVRIGPNGREVDENGVPKTRRPGGPNMPGEN